MVIKDVPRESSGGERVKEKLWGGGAKDGKVPLPFGKGMGTGCLGVTQGADRKGGEGSLLRGFQVSVGVPTFVGSREKT